jgi:type IV pilus assembly protein PilC
MLFNYEALDNTGAKKVGSIDAVNVDVAIASLQRRGLVITSVVEAGKPASFLSVNVSFLDHVSTKDVVILSRQLSTLFEAQVSALRIFRLLGAETEKRPLAVVLEAVADDLQSGNSISAALEKHPKVFTEFYVSMVKAGEESGKLNDTFSYLADYLDRNYELTSKVRGALIYPAFVTATFFGVMILMFTVIIPKITPILEQSGATIPVYTTIIIGVSNFLVQYGLVLLAGLIVAAFFLIRFIRTPAGKFAYDRAKLSVPYVSSLYRKLYLSRLADNMNTMLSSGIPMVRALELTSTVINNGVYRKLLTDAIEAVKGGVALSDALAADPKAIPGIMTQMTKVGEEAGEVGPILKTLSNFYAREVTTAVDALVSLIEPAMIVVMGAGVAILMAAVLVPIYSIAQSSGS